MAVIRLGARDSGTAESRLNDPTRRDLAIKSGAQLISTDYPEPDKRFSDYQVTPELIDAHDRSSTR